MKTKTGASKVNVSMPKDLFDYLKKCVEEHNARPENAYGPTDFSKMVQKAVREMMKHDCKENSAQKPSSKASKISPPISAKGKAASPEHVGAKTLKLSENLDTGSSKAGTGRFRKTG